MDRQQDKHYEEEQIETQGMGIENTEPVDDMRFFIGLIKLMRETVVNGKGLGRWKLIDSDQFISMLDELDDNLPVAIQYGLQMYSERDRILGNSEKDARDRITTAEMRAKATKENAQREAERILADAQDEANAIVEDAQQRADFMVSEDEILRRAREEARGIKNDAAIDAREMLLKANHDALQLISGVEEELTLALENVGRRRKELTDVNKD